MQMLLVIMRLVPSKFRSRVEGAAFVEFIFALPVFFLLITFFMWLAVLLNARTSLTLALGYATRLALTRADDARVGKDLILPVNDWIDNGRVDESLARLLFADTKGADWAHYSSSNSSLSPVASVFGESLQDMPKQYAYILIYIYESIRQSVGSSARFPCDPRNLDGTDDSDGFGCVKCEFLHPQDLSLENERYGLDVPRTRARIRCEYKPDGVLSRLVSGMFGLVTGSSRALDANLIITRTTFFDVAEGRR